MTELQKARADWIAAQGRIIAVERENESLRRRLFETQSAAINAVTQMYIAGLSVTVASVVAR